jgi:hypothetical protein
VQKILPGRQPCLHKDVELGSLLTHTRSLLTLVQKILPGRQPYLHTKSAAADSLHRNDSTMCPGAMCLWAHNDVELGSLLTHTRSLLTHTRSLLTHTRSLLTRTRSLLSYVLMGP